MKVNQGFPLVYSLFCIEIHQYIVFNICLCFSCDWEKREGPIFYTVFWLFRAPFYAFRGACDGVCVMSIVNLHYHGNLDVVVQRWPGWLETWVTLHLMVSWQLSRGPATAPLIQTVFCKSIANTWSVGVSWHQSMAERMADGKKQKPPSAIALAVSVANASQLHLLTILPAVETSLDSKEMMGSVRKRWTTTVNHMEEMLHDDPDHGHALMVNLSCKIYSFSNANWSAMSLG